MALEGINQRWRKRFEKQSPHYMTQLRGLLVARVP